MGKEAGWFSEGFMTNSVACGRAFAGGVALAYSSSLPAS